MAAALLRMISVHCQMSPQHAVCLKYEKVGKNALNVNKGHNLSNS